MKNPAMGWLLGLALAWSAGAHGETAPVARTGKPGPPMFLGTSVMSAGENLLVKSIGFSHAQTDSDHLTVNEPYPGLWDWTEADAGLAAMRAAGMKWQYFPHFHWAPEWYQRSSAFVPCTGVRTGRKLAAISIWSPDIVPWFEHCYAALAEHYGPGNSNLYAIYLGVHGDFGETIFPMGWHPAEVERFGSNATGAADFWCGDEYARADFRLFARGKYGALPELNAAWGTVFPDFEAVNYPPAAQTNKMNILATAQSRRYWLDFIEWYFDSMSQFTGNVCRIARQYFPESLLEIPIGGGNETLLYAQDTTALPKMAGRYGVHVRSTHGGYASFAGGYAAMIKRIATPCKIYGVPHWLEPPNAITPEHEVGRIMEALSCGNYGFWDWGANPVGAADVFRQYTHFLTREEPVVDVALFFPTTDHRLHPEDLFPRQLQNFGARLRDRMDFDMVDEELLLDGGLSRYRVLVWVEGRFVEAQTLNLLADWLQRGGVLVYGGKNPPETVEGSTELGAALTGLQRGAAVTDAGPVVFKESAFLPRVAGVTSTVGIRSLDKSARVLAAVRGQPVAWAIPEGKGWVLANGGGAGPIFDALVEAAAYRLSQLDPTKKDALRVETAKGVYATLLANGEIMLYNSGNQSTTNRVGGQTVMVPAHALRSVRSPESARN
jgi:hypothetical protein